MTASGAPGRSCPLDYRYGARALARANSLATDALWIAGGLYGNPFSLRRLQEMVRAERVEASLVFNGDFHWFDVDDAVFADIEEGVSNHVATRGNVETEIAHPRSNAGCGCAYPDWVGDEDVARSNRIIERLRATTARAPGVAKRLAALPMFRVAEVGGQRVAVVHGDADSLAGWNFSQEVLATAAGRNAASGAFAAANVSVFASSHTCLPVLQTFDGARAVVNNGAAGMPNFAGTTFGLATRISVTPARHALYRARSGKLHIEAIAIDYDAAAWRETFLAQWPPESDAHAAYWRRIVSGPGYPLDAALRAA
ncbi:MAG: metallophosphoesterase family protein [Burkholderiales bacterium]